MRAFACLCCAALLTWAAFGQTGGPAPAFEAADVHVSGPTSSPFPFVKGPFFRGGRYEVRFATMVDLISAAYGVSAEKWWAGRAGWNRTVSTLSRKSRLNRRPTQEMLKGAAGRPLQIGGPQRHQAHAGLRADGGQTPHAQESRWLAGQYGCKFVAPQAAPGGGRGGPPPTITFTCHNMTMAALADVLRDLWAADSACPAAARRRWWMRPGWKAPGIST